MKKLFAILLVAVMMLSLVACGGDEPNPAIVKYMNENGADLIEGMEQSFATSSGMTCTSSYEVIGNGFAINVNINELEDLPDETKELMQKTYDAMSGAFGTLLPAIQAEIPELEYFDININEKDGDRVATIHIGEE